MKPFFGNGIGTNHCRENGEYNDFFIDKLKRNEKKKAFVNTKNGYFVCKDKDQIPVIYDVHVDYMLEYLRYKSNNNIYNVFLVLSCQGNKNNGYFIIQCQYK